MALAQRRHKVQLVTCAWAEDKMGAKCREAGCDFVGLAPHVLSAECGKGKAAEFMARGHMMSMFEYYDREMYDPFRKLVSEKRPDVIVADFVTPCAWHVADEFGIPVMINMPCPLKLLKFFSPLTSLIFRTTHYWSTARTEYAAMTRIFDEMTGLPYKRPCVLHTFFGFEAPEPVLPSIIITGSTAPRNSDVTHTTSMATFNTWLEWVRREGLKIVYVTMGSMQVLLDHQVKGLYEGLSRIPGVAVAWSLKEDQQSFLPGGGLQGLPKRFFISKWMPQAEALNLPEVAVVVTHCGWGGLNETICAGKPIAATPFRADQPVNAAIAKRQGMCEIINTKIMSAQAVEKTVIQVLSNPSYSLNAQKMQSALLKTGGAVRCAEAIEDLAENGCNELTSEAPTLVQELAPVGRPICYVALGAVLSWLVPVVIPALQSCTMFCVRFVRRPQRC